jgi:predicted phage terminase large subunit-like protein
LIQHPRSTFKTTIDTIVKRIQDALKDPGLRILIVGNTAINASGHLSKIKRHFDTNRLLRWLYPDRFWQDARSQATEWSKLRLYLPTKAVHGEPTFDTIGARGAVVSRHYDIINVDDIIADDEYTSEVEMDRTIEWASGLESLLVPPIDEGLIDVPCTYWSTTDVYTFFEKFWGGNHMPVVTGPYSYQRGPLAVFRRAAIEDGKSIFPEAFSIEWLERLQNENPERYAAQYANNPFAAGVSEFRPEWLRFYELYGDRTDLLIPKPPGQPDEPPVKVDRLVRVSMCDPHAGGGNRFKSSRAAVITTGVDVKKGRIYILDCWIKRAPTNEIVTEIIRQNNYWAPQVFSVESNGFQKMLKFWLEERVQRDGHPDIPIDEYRPRGDKDGLRRIKGLQPLFRAGNVWMLSSFVELKEEYMAYPRGLQDGLDALAQGLDHWNVGFESVSTAENDEYERVMQEMRSTLTGY